MIKTIFKRYENKYILNERQYQAVLRAIEKNTVPDKYGQSNVCSIYYDTPDRRLIRASQEKPVYKEKLRLRSYGVPRKDSDCFLELKKKYKGVVYKRRIVAPYSDGIDYMAGNSGVIPPSQIKNEIEYFKKYYGVLSPSVDIFYSYGGGSCNGGRLYRNSGHIYRDSLPCQYPLHRDGLRREHKLRAGA